MKSPPFYLLQQVRDYTNISLSFWLINGQLSTRSVRCAHAAMAAILHVVHHAHATSASTPNLCAIGRDHVSVLRLRCRYAQHERSLGIAHFFAVRPERNRSRR